MNVASDRRCGRSSLGCSVARLGVLRQGCVPLHHLQHFFFTYQIFGAEFTLIFVHPVCSRGLAVVEDIYTSSRHHPEMTHLLQRGICLSVRLSMGTRPHAKVYMTSSYSRTPPL